MNETKNDIANFEANTEECSDQRVRTIVQNLQVPTDPYELDRLFSHLLGVQGYRRDFRAAQDGSKLEEPLRTFYRLILKTFPEGSIPVRQFIFLFFQCFTEYDWLRELYENATGELVSLNPIFPLGEFFDLFLKTDGLTPQEAIHFLKGNFYLSTEERKLPANEFNCPISYKEYARWYDELKKSIAMGNISLTEGYIKPYDFIKWCKVKDAPLHPYVIANFEKQYQPKQRAKKDRLEDLIKYIKLEFQGDKSDNGVYTINRQQKEFIKQFINSKQGQHHKGLNPDRFKDDLKALNKKGVVIKFPRGAPKKKMILTEL